MYIFFYYVIVFNPALCLKYKTQSTCSLNLSQSLTLLMQDHVTALLTLNDQDRKAMNRSESPEWYEFTDTHFLFTVISWDSVQLESFSCEQVHNFLYKNTEEKKKFCWNRNKMSCHVASIMKFIERREYCKQSQCNRTDAQSHCPPPLPPLYSPSWKDEWET